MCTPPVEGIGSLGAGARGGFGAHECGGWGQNWGPLEGKWTAELSLQPSTFLCRGSVHTHAAVVSPRSLRRALKSRDVLSGLEEFSMFGMSGHWVKDSCLGSSRANKLWSRLNEMVHTFYPNTWETEERASLVQGQWGACRNFKASQDYLVKPYLKKKVIYSLYTHK